MPEARWHTHLACLERLGDSAMRGLDLADVAGLTGLAFRTALTRQVTPAGLYLSWAWEPSFRRWLSALGLDAEISGHHGGLPGFDAWLGRQHAHIEATLQRGFPVLFWDNAGFSLILGTRGDDYLAAGVAAMTVHPIWHEREETQGFCGRLLDPLELDAQPRRLGRSELASVIEPEGLFIYLQGLAPFDQPAAERASLLTAFYELTGRVEFPRVRDNLELVYEPRYGTAALERWREELKDGRVHPFGMILALQALGEARRLAAKYLKRVAERSAPGQQDRLVQAAQFFARIGEHLRPLLGVYRPPLNEEEQMTRLKWDQAREVLYQVQQTEQTAGRLLASLAQEVVEE